MTEGRNRKRRLSERLEIRISPEEREMLELAGGVWNVLPARIMRLFMDWGFVQLGLKKHLEK